MIAYPEAKFKARRRLSFVPGPAPADPESARGTPDGALHRFFPKRDSVKMVVQYVHGNPSVTRECR